MLYEHSCHVHKLSAMDLLSFRLELVHQLLEKTGSIRGVVRARKVARDAAQSARVCELYRVSKIVLPIKFLFSHLTVYTLFLQVCKKMQ